MLCCVSLPQNIFWPRDEGKTSRPFGTPWTGESGFTNLLEKMNSHCMFWNQALERGGSWRGFWISLLKNSMLHFWSSGALTLDHPWAILFFPIHTIFQNDAIYRDIFLALNWSQMCIISSKICPGSAYVPIVTKCCMLCVWENNVVFYDFCDKNAVFQVSSMVLIQHKYNSKWGRKAKMNWFKLTCAKLTSCNYLQVEIGLY